MIDGLIQVISSILPISVDLEKRLQEILHIESFPKKHFLLKEGQVCNHIYFIAKGLVRSYHLKGDKEVTNWFMKESDLIISVSSFYKRVPSKEYVHLLEDCTLLSIHYDELQQLYKDFVEFNIVGRVLTEKYYILSEERLAAIRLQKAEDRLHFISETYPDILQRASLGHIASYLGITLETISRIRAKR